MSGYVPRVGRRGGARAIPAQKVISTLESGLDSLGLHSRRHGEQTRHISLLLRTSVRLLYLSLLH